MVYTFSSKNRGSKFLEIEFLIENNNSDSVFVQLPSWRPGRYELADFAKNIQEFEVKTMNNKPLVHRKVSKDEWEIETSGIKRFKVCYNYYANELNAGSTWVDEDQIYVNPVNCCLFVKGREKEPIKVFIDAGKKDKVATGMQKIGDHYVVESFDELADSPFVSSNKIQKIFYEVAGTPFYLWFQGECKPDKKKLISDFKKFTKVQLKMMGSFPFKEYHFIYQILPYKGYHGVEHLNSTVISYGPGYGIMEGEDYEEILGVSSHELFHAWNVKSIRPSDMVPYDFTKENYSKMGYLTEGVTTYYGDLFLKRSGVFSEEQFLKQVNKTLDRHFFNYGTQNMSVADSSFDTWLDGYVKGIPNRKSSIYTEGCLLALATDLIIREKTNGKRSLDTVMNTLFHKYALKGKGISEKDYKKELELVLGREIDFLWDNYYYGTSDYYELLKGLLPKFGFDLIKKSNQRFLACNYGLFMSSENNKVLMVAPDSPGFKSGVNVGDEIISINEMKLDGNNADKWAEYFYSEVNLLIIKDGRLRKTHLKPNSKTYFDIVKLQPIQSLKKKVSKNKENWLISN